MDTKISIIFKKGFGTYNKKIFMFDPREKLRVQIDNTEPQVLVPAKEPYIFNVLPGTHTIFFKDDKQGSKRTYRKIMGGAFGLGMDLGSGGSGFAEMFGNLAAGNTEYSSKLDVNVNEGDIVKISAKISSWGKVKIKQLR